MPGQSHAPVYPLTQALQKAVNASIGRAENQRFLEHFRYLIVASQLLGDHGGLRGSSIPSFVSNAPTPPQMFKASSLTGAGLTATTAFLLVWIIHWSRSPEGGLTKGRFAVVVVIFAGVATLGYAYMRRQWLHYLREQAVEGASTLVTNLQAFEASSSSAMALIQEVELVSRGYRLYVFSGA